MSPSNVGTAAVLLFFLVTFVRASKQPLWQEAFRRISKNGLALAAACVVGLYGVVAILDSIEWADGKGEAPISILDRVAQKGDEKTYSPPLSEYTVGELVPTKLQSKHLLGTDGIGKDVFYRALKGIRTAFLIGGLTTLIAVPLALLFGMLAGYFGKVVDDVIQYVYSVLASIPGILLLIAIILVLGKGVFQICVALGITGWVGLCRVVRGETLKHREREYVLAAKALGVRDFRILTRHILPNLLPIIVITAILQFSGYVLSETVLSFLGVGVPSEYGSWGNMIDSARVELAREPMIWWNLAGATAALFLLVLSLNILGDALRDAIDPRLRTM